MTESIQPILLDDNKFVEDLVNMTKKSDKDLKEFIDENLFWKNSSLGIEAISQNIESLKTMDKMQQLLVIGRADHFKESNDPSKYFPSLLVLFGFLIALYGQVKEITGIPLISLFVSALLILFLAWLLRKAMSTYPTAIYFQSLVTKIQYKN